MSDTLDFEITLTERPATADERARVLADPGFGRHFTDHMITIRYSADRGWYDARLQPYGPIPMDPASHVFHYAQELFEGLKAYKQPDGSIVTFRPYMNAARMNRSARRMAMPQIPEELFVRAVELLVGTDKAWVPDTEGHSLYIRPNMFATTPTLGVNSPASDYLFTIIASPSGLYYPRGVKPVSVWLSQDYTRAAPGGTGEAKTGGNYAASFAGQAQAVEHGCDQVVWLDAVEHRWVEEVGSMNLMFVYGSGSNARLLTPALTGTLLAGITRDSMLRLAPGLGIPAEEGKINVDEWEAGCASGEITEVFGCGTAAIISPVGHVKGSDREWRIGDGEPGEVSMRLREELIGIQYGTRPDPYGWVHKIA
ncbi:MULTISPECIES: branched-chain amino acid aminotransferase [Actinomadura]|uniref:branched-chain-amino-acid transaminase n=1 Tax=Actinomadura litoris TaxID=2678616 RepID=A0A7K1LE83_9ACTN|nr:MULTISPECIES: branched-chain amino acid aminotransferase [Actinomadura]MBT2213632.1 branched-chain amino acid aminotransferase [Actinomadura sp. NEAU-AAG7]MUN42751.1 branched-chain amino acid aminotransferase [Actinomadura litoris]